MSGQGRVLGHSQGKRDSCLQEDGLVFSEVKSKDKTKCHFFLLLPEMGLC